MDNHVPENENIFFQIIIKFSKFILLLIFKIFEAVRLLLCKIFKFLISKLRDMKNIFHSKIYHDSPKRKKERVIAVVKTKDNQVIEVVKITKEESQELREISGNQDQKLLDPQKEEKKFERTAEESTTEESTTEKNTTEENTTQEVTAQEDTTKEDTTEKAVEEEGTLEEIAKEIASEDATEEITEEEDTTEEPAKETEELTEETNGASEESKDSKRELQKQAEEEVGNTPVSTVDIGGIKYDTIDEDIYYSFIANKTGLNGSMGGTAEDLKKVEEEINKICAEHGGKFYKSAAKSAKFAIILNVKNRTESNVSSLREKGYKVTLFENALEYFKISDLWEIDKLKS